MTNATLLTELETATYDQRVQRMVALGRQARTDAGVASLLQNLASTDSFYERQLALLACYGSADGARVLAALGDESRLLRGLALNLVAHVCTDAQARAAFAALPRRMQPKLLRNLRKQGRTGVVDALLEELAADSAARLAQFLYFGTADLVEKHLAAVLPGWGSIDWQRLAKYHPALAFARLHGQQLAQTAPDARLLHHVNAVLPVLAEQQPGQALALLRELFRHESPVRLDLLPVARRRPNEVVDLLLQHADGAGVRLDLSRLAPQLTEARLLAALQQRPALVANREAWLHRVPPSVRQAAFEVAGNGWRNAEGVVPASLVAQLPGPLRAAEARRHLALPALATRPEQRLPYAAFLPWEEARALLDPYVRNPDADLRTVALTTQIELARYHRARLPAILALVRARANEQDPVRQAMLAALAGLPPARWQTAQLDELSQIIRDALNAADLSAGTARYAEQLVVALVPFQPAWAATWLGELAQSRGVLYLPNIADQLNDADVRRIAPALLPVLQAWATRERESFLVQVAFSLGPRLRAFPELADLLAGLLATTRQNYVAAQSLQLLAEYQPARFRTLIPALLQSDPSVITLHPVYTYLHRQRQDLLTPFLGQRAYKGRFSTGNTRFVLPLFTHFYRWTATQQHLFADTLTELTRDGQRDTYALFQAIRQLAALPAVVPTRLFVLADARMQRLAVRDTALRALARLDGGQGVPVLMEALADTRARIAIYALRSTLLEMPAPRALALLQAAPTEKVTVAKEVLRLLGDLDTPAAYPLLLDMAARPLHRDVRVALLRALWGHLARPETWPILRAAAADPDPAVAAGVAWIPTDRLTPPEQQLLLALLATLLGHPDAALRVQVLGRCVELPIADPNQVLLPPLLVGLHSPLPDEYHAAARAVLATYAVPHPAAIVETVALVLPERRVLQAVLDALRAALPGNRSRLQPLVQGLLAVLHPDPLTVRVQVQLAVAGLPWNELAAYLTNLAATDLLDAESLLTAAEAIARSGPSAGQPSDANSLAAFERALAASSDARLRRLALAALLAQATQPTGWTTALRARLAQYGTDPAALVAAAAQFTFPPPLQEPAPGNIREAV
ncbi:hypothetical protein [Hymenobacter actinosclerus]|uniref:HEAT repeat n=1 Tax=Hymenobacter actinosclerus TaxID=82805 RepID=A0A1I0E8S3_9BACT|nr:hypothetical protein [Hymenobacter actinosclerus]SET40860.1 hypothetical protein SAMN04487998_1722 [Hymenobacter actinosclerus]